MSYRILSFDGGGYRGLFTCRVLARIQNRTHGVIHRANMLAGVSTGGLIACGLAAGLKPGELITLYVTQARRIFADSILDDVRDLGGLIGAKYGLSGMRDVFDEVFGPETTLGNLADRSGKSILIASFGLDLETAIPELQGARIRMARPKMFSTFDSEDRKLLVTDVLQATAAAPTYFPARKGYIDGGIVATNPSMFAVTEALNWAGDIPEDGIHVASFGTGLNPTRVAGAHDRRELDWGLQQWAPILPQLMIDGQAFVVDTMAKAILNGGGLGRYQRIDGFFPRSIEMDDHSESATDRLIAAANAMSLQDAVDFFDETGWGKNPESVV